MKISKRSWHYRLIRWTCPDDQKVAGELPPMSLCKYAFELGFMFVFGPPFLVMAAIIFCFFAPVILIWEWMENRSNSRKGVGPKEPRTLFGKWLKTKREKVCPLLEWIDE